MKQLQQRQNQAGFSLLEMVVATAILIVMLGAAAGMLSRFQVTSSDTRHSLNLTQNVRGAFDSIVRDSRLAGGGLQTIGYGVVTAENKKLVLRGNFSRIATTATVVTASGLLTVVSTSGFVSGQTVALWEPTSGTSAFSSILQVGTTTLTISPTLTPITAGAKMADFGPGTTVDVIERVTYTIDDGTIKRTVAPELSPLSGTTASLAEWVLDDDDDDGLKFEYYGIDPVNPLIASDDVEVKLTGSFTPSAVKRIEVTLTARSENLRSDTNEYEYMSLKESIRPRGQ